MSKILILTTIGGFLPQFELNSVNILQRLGFEVHYASNFNNPVYALDKDELRKMGIKLHHVDIHKSPFRLIKNAKALLQLKKIMKMEKIARYHFHNPVGGVLGRISALLLGKAKYIIYTAHGFHFYKGAPLLNWLLFYPVEHILAKKTNCLITINKEDYLRAKRICHKSKTNITMIPGVGVDTKKFRPIDGKREEIRNELGINDNTFYIISVGELNDNKNNEVILKAIAELNDPRLHYGICGAGYKETYLRNLAEKLGIEKQFTLFGYMHNIPEMLHAADCFAFPSKREGLGIAAIEAMATGIPLITSDCRGTREYMEDGVTGYVCYSGKPSEYAEKIRMMMASSKNRKALADTCRKRSIDFDKENTYEIIEKAYRKIPT